MIRIATGILGLVFVAASATIARADSIFNFEDVALSTATTFTETNNGVTATFASSLPGAFDIEVDPNGIGFGQRLIQTEASLPNFASLMISFGGQQFQSVNLPFAVLGLTSDTPIPQLTLQALLGGTPVGNIVVNTTTNLPVPPDPTAPFYSTGLLNFSPGTAFDSLVLSSSRPGFAIDDLSLSTAAVSGVPEPAPIALLMFGIAGMLAFVRHRQRRHTASLSR